MASNLLRLMVLCTVYVIGTQGHGFMVSPPARNSAWRYGFDTPKNYNDNELFCGGREVHHGRNGGQCGVCGDPFHAPTPRPHERGGRYGRGVITASYKEGQVIPVTIQVSANHKGYYEFRLCNNNNPNARDSQRCLDKQLLELADGSGTRYVLKSGIRGKHTMHVQLPRRLTCTHCVMQWTWVAGNNWGVCEDGSGRNGCGPQETFVNCADVEILPKEQRPTVHKPSSQGPANSGPKPSRPTTLGRPIAPESSGEEHETKPFKPSAGGGKPYVPEKPAGVKPNKPATGVVKPYPSKPTTGGQRPYLPIHPHLVKPSTGHKRPTHPKKHNFIPWAWIPARRPTVNRKPQNKPKVIVSTSWGEPYWF